MKGQAHPHTFIPNDEIPKSLHNIEIAVGVGLSDSSYNTCVLLGADVQQHDSRGISTHELSPVSSNVDDQVLVLLPNFYHQALKSLLIWLLVDYNAEAIIPSSILMQTTNQLLEHISDKSASTTADVWSPSLLCSISTSHSLPLM